MPIVTFQLQIVTLLSCGQNFRIIGKNKPNWKGASLIVEICLCALFSNATLEHFFSHTNIIKSETNWLSQSSLNAVLHICMFSMPLAEFSQTCGRLCHLLVQCKEHRLGQWKCKEYSKQKSTLKKCETLDVRELLSETSSESSASDSVSGEIYGQLWQLYMFPELFWTILRTKKTVLILLTKSLVIICLSGKK